VNQLAPSGSGSLTPFLVEAAGAVGSVSVGGDGSTSSQACATSAQGTLCWGTNDLGQLGIGAFGSKGAPTKVGEGTWKSVGAGVYHTCGLRADGALFCWGRTPGPSTQSPTQFGSNSTWKSLGVGSNHQCAIAEDGGLSCWGDGLHGQLGLGADMGIVDEPTPVGTDEDWLEVSGAERHTCGIRAGGKLYCWGSNDENAVGDGSSDDVLSPIQIGAAMTWSHVATGSGTCAITTLGTLHCWGGDHFGPVPEQVGTDSDWLAVAVAGQSAYRVCGIRAPGTLHCLGDAPLGDGTFDASDTFLQVGAAADWKSIETGPYSCGIRADNSLHCWGSDIGLAARPRR
jgi:alpha-tubulin suppressor-like RCC1 family protein